MTPEEYKAAKRREYQRVYQKKYRADNPELIRAIEQRRYAKDRKKRIAQQAVYRKRRREIEKELPKVEDEV